MFEKPTKTGVGTAITLLVCCVPLLLSVFCFTVPWRIRASDDVTVAYPLWPIAGWLFALIGVVCVAAAILAAKRNDREAQKVKNQRFHFDAEGKIRSIDGQPVGTGPFVVSVLTLNAWRVDLIEMMHEHQRHSKLLRKLNVLFGGLNVLFVAITASTIYAAFNGSLTGMAWYKQIGLMIIGIMPGISVGFQKEWKLLERAREHTVRSTDYQFLLNDLDDLIIRQPGPSGEEIKAWLLKFEKLRGKVLDIVE